MECFTLPQNILLNTFLNLEYPVVYLPTKHPDFTQVPFKMEGFISKEIAVQHSKNLPVTSMNNNPYYGSYIGWDQQRSHSSAKVISDSRDHGSVSSSAETPWQEILSASKSKNQKLKLEKQWSMHVLVWREISAGGSEDLTTCFPSGNALWGGQLNL